MTAWRFSLEPLTGGAPFFGRDRVVGEIRDLMTAGPSPDFVFVHGGQKIGRTSLLKQLRARGRELIGEDVRTCLVDLRLWSVMQEEAIVGHFATTLAQAVGPPGLAPRQAGPELLDGMLQRLAASPEAQLVLAIDRGDALIDPALRRRVATLLGLLNDSLPNLGIVLSFGTGEGLSGQHVLHRIEQVEEAISEISPVWTRATTRILGALPRPDTHRFLRAAGPLARFEADWIVELAGDHPFLLNRVGLSASRSRSGPLTGERRAEIEETLVRELLPMGLAILQRLRSGSRGSDLVDFACELAEPGDRPPRGLAGGAPEAPAVDILAGEGLVQVEDADGRPVVLPVADLHEDARVAYWMPSRLFRRVIRASVRQERSRAAGRGLAPRAVAAPRQRAARVEVMSEDDGQTVVTVALTDIERRILQRLLQAPGGLLDAVELSVAVWGPAPDPHSEDLWRERLRQRLIGLRRKLAPHVSGEPIVNVYGKGYRLAAPERFSLR
jgi:hypothetical protein